jgi:hypothetical protein
MASLFRELVEQGYKGSYASVRDGLIRLLPQGRKFPLDSSAKMPALVTSQRASFLCIRRLEELETEEQELLRQLRQLHRSASMWPMNWSSSLLGCCVPVQERSLMLG